MQDQVRGRVLLVDDEALLRHVYGRALGRAGYVVTLADDGLEGEAMFRRGGFDVVVTDVEMPRLSGLELLERVRRHDAAMTVIVMTASPDESVRVRAELLGAQELLVKPLDVRELVVAVAEAVAG